MRKKLLTAIIIGSILVTLAACSNSSKNTNADTNNSTTEVENNKSNVNDTTKTNNKEKTMENNDMNSNNENKKKSKSNISETNNSSKENSIENNIQNPPTDNKKHDNNKSSTDTSNKNNSQNNSKNSKNEESKNINSSSNQTLEKLAKKLGKYEYADHSPANIIPVKVSRHNNDLTFEKDATSNVFLYTTEKFSTNIKSGLLILLFPDEEKDNDKTYHTFKISSINLIENGGTGTVDVGRIYSDGTIKIGNE